MQESEVQTLVKACCLVSIQLFYSYKELRSSPHSGHPFLHTNSSTHTGLAPNNYGIPLSAPPCCTQGVETLSSSGPFSIPFTFQCIILIV